MKKQLILFFLIVSINLFGQQLDTTLIKEIPILKDNVFRQRQEINAISKTLITQSKLLKSQKTKIKHLTSLTELQTDIIDSLSQIISNNKESIVANSSKLGTEIKQIGNEASTKITTLDNELSQNRLYWILASLGTILLGGLMYLFLGKRINASKTDVETQIRNTKQSLEEEGIKLDSKLVEVLETQLKIQQETIPLKGKINKGQGDHALALKVADEIIRIQKNLSRMDEKTKGLKQLNSSVKRIKDNFISNGYELVDMLGKDYHEGMKVTANFIPSEEIKNGQQLITRIIKPQVNFKDEMIQAAQIEVSVGE